MTFTAREFAAHGLPAALVECNISYNARRGTLRGLHYQAAPHAQPKLVRCTAGAVLDVIVDLRPESPTFTRWAAVELTAANRLALFIPEGMAHGFETLADGTELLYQMSTPYRADAGRGVRWNDPAFGIAWPIDPPIVIAARDASYPDFTR
jgi:dTDP-4-dehydrorhamnose 3,5-epimerase